VAKSCVNESKCGAAGRTSKVEVDCACDLINGGIKPCGSRGSEFPVLGRKGPVRHGRLGSQIMAAGNRYAAPGLCGSDPKGYPPSVHCAGPAL
jgi:hypothetical protein